MRIPAHIIAKSKVQGLPKGSSMSHLELKFLDLWKRCDGLDLEPQHKFHATRKWRFDFAHPKTKIAIEIEGGEFVGGRHGRPGALTKDCEKYANAMRDGWEVWRLTGSMITDEWVNEIATRVYCQSQPCV